MSLQPKQCTISVLNSGVKRFALVFLKHDWQDGVTVKLQEKNTCY